MRKKKNSATVDLNRRLFFEGEALKKGYSRIAGIDEAGRGPLAGPVVAAAVVINDANFTERIDDSKKLTARMRERAFLDIIRRCDVGIGQADVKDVDRLNIYNATMLAMERAISELKIKPDYMLIDGRMPLPVQLPRKYLINGESLSVSIACASIIAKVFRDRLMVDEDRKYPQYGFSRHKGYGTRYHMEAIRKHGLSPVHRMTFGPFGKRREFPKRGAR